MSPTPDAPTAPSGRSRPISAAADHVLFERWQDRRDVAAREELLARYLPLARKLARRYMRSSGPFDDLVQVASLGLVKALDRFDASRGNRFVAFAVPTVLGELRRYFRDAAWAVHVPRGTQERALAVEDAQRELTGRTGRPPTVEEIAQYLELSLEDVLSALQAGQAYDALSLDAPRRSGEGEMEPFGDSLGSEDERFALIDDDVTVTAALRILPARERRILYLRFVEDMTQSEIADAIGLSQMQISRLLRRSLAQLREFTETPLPSRSLPPASG